MDNYFIYFSLILVGIILASLFNSLKKYIVHISIICAFHALGPSLLPMSIDMFNQHSVGGWVILFVFFSGYIESLSLFPLQEETIDKQTA